MPEDYAGPRWQPDAPGQVEFIDPNGWYVPAAASPPPAGPPPGRPQSHQAWLGGIVIALVAVLVAGIVVSQRSSLSPQADPSQSTPVSAFPSQPSSAGAQPFPTGLPSGLPSGFPSTLPSGLGGSADSAIIALNVSLFAEGLDLDKLAVVNGAMCNGAELTQADLDKFGQVESAVGSGTSQITGSTATAPFSVTTTDNKTTSYTLALTDPSADHLSWCISGVK